MMMMDSGSEARKRMLFAAVRWSMEDGGVYWTSERAKSGGRPALAMRVDGMKPVSSCCERSV